MFYGSVTSLSQKGGAQVFPILSTCLVLPTWFDLKQANVGMVTSGDDVFSGVSRLLHKCIARFVSDDFVCMLAKSH